MEDNQEKFNKLKIGKSWSVSEGEQLKKLYEEGKDIAYIAEQLGRDKNILTKELVKLKLIDKAEDARGLDNYKKSEYYKLVQEFYNNQKEVKKKNENEKNKTIKKIANTEIFDKKDFKTIEEQTHHTATIINELSLNNKMMLNLLEKIIIDNEHLKKSIDEIKLKLNIEDNNSKKEDPKTEEKKEETKIIKYKKKEYIVHNNKLYTKTESNKKGIIVGKYEDGKVIMD